MPATMADVLALDVSTAAGWSIGSRRCLPRRGTSRSRSPSTGNTIMTETGIDSAWTFLLDVIHHRGQLSTYLRAMGSTVPQIYGPSADEPMM